MFDIHAALSRQRTRDGRKVDKIFDSGLDIKSPIVAWVDGRATSYRRNGSLFDNCDNIFDLITLPLEEDIERTFYEVSKIGIGAAQSNFEYAMMHKKASTRFVLQLAHYTNTDKTTLEIVWRQES